MASRSLIDLAAPVRHAAMAFQAACHARGMNALIYCTLRSNEEQAALYAQGRTAPVVHGVAMWSDDAALLTMGECGESVGLAWAGRWRGPLRELVHFQIERWSNT